MTQQQSVLAALDGLKSSGLKGNLILCCMRGDDTAEPNFETLKIARKYLVEDGGVVAVDLAGAEALYPTKNYKELFERASEYLYMEMTFGLTDGQKKIILKTAVDAAFTTDGVKSELKKKLHL